MAIDTAQRESAPKVTRFILPGILAMALTFVVAVLLAGIAAPSLLGDPGPFVRWALPATRAIHHTSMALAVAALVFAAAIVPRAVKTKRAAAGEAEDQTHDHPAFTRCMNIAAGAGVVWTLSAAGVLMLTFWDLAGIPINLRPEYSVAMLDYIMGITTGRAWAWMVVISAITTSLALAVRSKTGVGLAAVFSMSGIIPLAFIGHASGGDDHFAAVNSIGLHLLAVVLWFGGIMMLGLLAPAMGGEAPGRQRGQLLAGVVLKRFSAVAAGAIFLMIGSGVASAVIRVTEVGQLFSTYGFLLMGKALLTLMLGALGLMHRSRVIPKLLAGDYSVLKAAWSVIAVEVAIMAAVMSLATVLARTAPPTSDEAPPVVSPARLLTGYDLPEAPTMSSWFTVWRMDWIWVAVCLFGLAFYVWAFITLRRRGDKPSILRLASWIVGLAALFYVTSGAVAVYGKVQFSTHMIDHMSLTMIVPIFLVLGMPVTLLLQALTPRTDGTRGPREWINYVIHSRYSKVITHPIFAAVNFAGSIVIFYFSPVLEPAMVYHAGHELMNLHFLLTGYLFALSLIDADPVPKRYPYPIRLVALLATVAFHAFVGVALMSTTQLLAPDYFGNMGRTWGGSAIADQELGAGYMWAIGEVPTLVLAIMVAVSWLRQDNKDTKRYDRKADRDGDAELEAYNQMFERYKKIDEKETRG